jgi:signal transduction histidine kinase
MSDPKGTRPKEINSSFPSSGPSGESEEAEQLAALAVGAVQLLFTRRAPPDSVEQFVRALRATRGIRSVFPLDRRKKDRRAGDRRMRTNITIPLGGTRLPHSLGSRPDEQRSLVVELAEPGDSRWHGPDQRRRLESTLALIAAAASAYSHNEDGVARTSLQDGRFIMVRFERDGWTVLSDSATSVLGHPIDVTLRSSPISLVHPADRGAAVRAFVSARHQSRATRPQDLRVRCANGAWTALETVFVRASGEPRQAAVIGCAWDVTHQHADRTRLYQIVMKSDSAVLVVDEHADLVLVNEAFTTLFPLRAKARWGNGKDAALRAIAARCADGERVYRHLADLTSRAYRWGERLELVDGHVVDINLAPLHDESQALGAVWHFRDVTPERPANGRPEQEGDVFAMAETQTAALLPTLSHELRSPLTALLSFVDLLSDPRLGPLNSDQRMAADVIARNTNHLIRLVDDMLLLTMLEGKQLPMRTTDVNVAQLVRAAVADREIDARAHGVVMSCDVERGPPLRGDTERLHQVMANVLGNALKFTQPNGRIHVTAKFESQHWIIEVGDSGIGISPEDLTRVTKSFTRGSNARHAGIAGSGLGLAVTRHVVELHHGTLNIESALNVGTTVRIELPVISVSP